MIEAVRKINRISDILLILLVFISIIYLFAHIHLYSSLGNLTAVPIQSVYPVNDSAMYAIHPVSFSIKQLHFSSKAIGTYVPKLVLGGQNLSLIMINPDGELTDLNV